MVLAVLGTQVTGVVTARKDFGCSALGGERIDGDHHGPVRLAHLQPLLERPVVPQARERVAVGELGQLLPNSRVAGTQLEQPFAEGELGIVIRDALITRISGKTAGALKTTEGKEILKLELIELLDSLVFPDSREGKVTALFYHDLLVQ